MTSPYARPSTERPASSVVGHQPVHGAPVAGSPVAASPAAGAAPMVPPMYWRVLRLSAVRPNGWQRAVLVEGVIGISVILALADVASAWTIVVLPLVAMAVVKAHDHLVGLLDPARRAEPPPARAADYATFAGIPIVILLLRLFVHPSGGERDMSLIVLGLAITLAYSVLVYRYLVRRGVPKRRALTIMGATFLLSPFAGILGAALEARRVRQGSEGVPASPPYDG